VGELMEMEMVMERHANARIDLLMELLRRRMMEIMKN
jgi:hypothetical protein